MVKYIEEGFTLVPMDKDRESKDIKALQKKRVSTSERDLTAWLNYGYDIGILLGYNTGFVAIEVLNMQGHLTLDLWSNNRIVPTFEYLVRTNPPKPGLHPKPRFQEDFYTKIYIYKLPEGFYPKDYISFYTESEAEIQAEADTVSDSFVPSKDDYNLVVWGQGQIVPLPERIGSVKDFTVIRTPRMLKAYGGIPSLPKFLRFPLDGGIIRKERKKYFPVSAINFVSSNLMKYPDGKLLSKKVYEAYVLESFSMGHMPVSELKLLEIIKAAGYSTFISTKGDKKVRYIKGALTVPYSLLDETTLKLEFKKS